MGFSDYSINNNGKKEHLNNAKNGVRKEQVDKKFHNLFDAYDANGDGTLENEELGGVFKSLTKFAGADKTLDSAENMQAASLFANQAGIQNADFMGFVKSISDLSRPSSTIGSEITIDNVGSEISLTEKNAQEEVISEIVNDASEARELLRKQDNGILSEVYDNYKELSDDDLSLSNIEERLLIEEEGAENLYKAKEGKLTKREYFLQNREHLKTMMKRRLFRKDENTGLDFLDNNRGNMSKEKFAQYMEEYINNQIDKIDKLDSLKKAQHRLYLMSETETDKMLLGYKNNAEHYAKITKGQKSSDLNGLKSLSKDKKKGISIPEEYNTTELMTFAEVFKFERGQDYSKAKVENYLSQKQKTEFVTGAYNKYQSFKTASEEFLGNYNKFTQGSIDSQAGGIRGNEPIPESQMKKVVSLFTSYYSNSINPDLAKDELKRIVSENNLPISVLTNKNGELELDLSALGSDRQKNQVLNRLLILENQKLKNNLESILGGSIEDKMLILSTDTQIAYENAYGSDFSKDLVELMNEDNKSFIQRYTGDVSMAGMGLTVVGGILCFTPAAPLGAGMLTVGNTLAIGGMVAESGLGYTEALTRSSLNSEEIEELSKTLVMNAGGFVVGMKAGKAGMQAFNKLIDKKLVEVFKTEITKGNRAQALKEIFSNPEYLKNFMTAAGVKLGTDFIISYAGDLAMMGVLGTDDDWMSLLKSNLIGVMVGMSGDIKDVAHIKTKTPKIDTKLEVKSEGSKQKQYVVEDEMCVGDVVEVKDLDGNSLYYKVQSTTKGDVSVITYNRVQGLNNLNPKTMKELLNARNITSDEKALVENLYNKICELGFKDYIDKNPELIRGFACSADYINGKLFSEYENLKASEFEIIKYINEQSKNGYVSDETVKSIISRLDASIPHEFFKYFNIPEDQIPEKVERKCGDYVFTDSKETVLNLKKEAMILKEFLDKQEIPSDVTVTRVNGFGTLNQIKIGDKMLGDMMKNPAEIEEALKFLNGNNNSSVKFDNFIGTSLIKNYFNGDVVWEINVPKGSKAAFIDCAVPKEERTYCEREFLLQMGTELKITNAEYKNGKLYLKATAVQKSEIARPQGMNAQDDALIQKARKENPAVNSKLYLQEAKAERQVRINALDEQVLTSSKAKNIDKMIFDFDKTDKKAIQNIQKDIDILRTINPKEAKNLQTLLDVLTKDKKCSEVSREEIASVVQHIRRQYELEMNKITTSIKSLAIDNLGTFSSRVKGDMSLFDKIANFAKDNPDKPFAKAISDVRDAYGGRIVLKSVDMKSDPEVNALVNAGKYDEAGQLAMKKYSSRIMNFMNRIIEAENKDFGIERISNYTDGTKLSILDEGQIYDLQVKAQDNGFVVIREGKKTFSTKTQASGYPALQMNLKTKSGKTIELQIRFDEVDKYAEAEHFVYDSMTGKDIIGRHENTESVLYPFKEALTEKLTKTDYNNYYVKYSQAQYHYRFLKALGIETPEPKLQDFTPEGKHFDESLSGENLLKLHDVVEKLKKGTNN